MTLYPNLRYDYFEERPLSNQRGHRQRNVNAVVDPKVSIRFLEDYQPSAVVIWYYDLLEGQQRSIEGDHREAAWALTSFRIQRYVGDPGITRIPQRPEEIRKLLDFGEKPPIPDQLGNRARFHHYYRILSSSELINVSDKAPTTISIEVTEEWHNPKDGLISPIGLGSPVLKTHCVGGVIYNATHQQFVFPNSWGEDWGHQGFGAISPNDLDRFLVEGYGVAQIGAFPPVELGSLNPPLSGSVEKKILLWKTAWGGREVHGREIIDADTGERIAWTFLVRRGGFLDIEELFVWPSHRRQGYGTILTSLINELANEMQCELRALVGFVDAYPIDRSRLAKILIKMQLALRYSDIPSIAFEGRRLLQINAERPSPQDLRIPLKPAAPLEKLDPANATRLYTVWYGTNRKPIDSTDPNRGFSSDRDDCIHYGTCKVAIPRSHRFGSIGSKWWKRWLRWTDDRLKIEERTSQTQEEFWAGLLDKMIECDRHEREGLVFLHGYNVDFDEAAIRAAQIGFDLKVPGLTSFFSWPSCGTLLGYPVDEATIEASEHHITEFLKDFVARSGAQRVHLIAHSMGNRGLIRALHRLADGVADSHVPFGQIILAAPDIDCDTFGRLAEVYPRVGERTTLYVSPKDRAVGASEWIHKYPRVGHTPPVTIVAGIDTVEVPSFDVLNLLGHGYFAEAEALLHDIFDLMRRNESPAKRQRLVENKNEKGEIYWGMYR